MAAHKTEMRPASLSGLHAELASALRRRRVMLLSLAAESEHELVNLAGAVGGEERLAVLYARLDERAQREIAAIDHALERIAAGTYGQCETCGQTIEIPRLLAIPTAQSCASCAAVRARPGDEPTCELPAPSVPRPPRAGAAPRHRPGSRV